LGPCGPRRSEEVMEAFCDAPEALQAHASQQVRDGGNIPLRPCQCGEARGKFLGWNWAFIGQKKDPAEPGL